LAQRHYIFTSIVMRKTSPSRAASPGFATGKFSAHWHAKFSNFIVAARAFGFYHPPKSAMDARVQQRIRLYLRGEEAMGLSSLPIKVTAPAAMAAKPQAAMPQRTTQSTPPPSRLAPPTAFKPAASVPLPVTPRDHALSVADTDAPFTSPVLSRDEKIKALAELNEKQVRACARCRLHETRTQTVFGEGDVDASIFFIGEGPGENEDLTGRPFVGKAGGKLDEMIGAMGLGREQVFIANIVKCRPPENRVPAPDEVAACTPYLLRQLEIVRPKVIVTLGLPATKYMLKLNLAMSKMRGQWHSWRGIKLMPTYHPSYILRNYTTETRAAVWSDLRMVMKELGLTKTKSAESNSAKE
jgi:uracil-DNA glycosylase family 4